jgi:hypothetical protein
MGTRANYILCLGVAAMLLVAWGDVPMCQASIQLPGETQHDILAMLSAEDASTSSSSKARDHHIPPTQVVDPRVEMIKHLGMECLPFRSNSSGSTTSSNGPSVPSTFSADCLSKVEAAESTIVVWASGEYRLTLPMPPGNKLLRPPCA